jgi:hypothetical protein
MFDKDKCTATNERFGKMAAVTPLKMQCELVSSCPAANSMEAAITLYAILGQCVTQTESF